MGTFIKSGIHSNHSFESASDNMLDLWPLKKSKVVEDIFCLKVTNISSFSLLKAIIHFSSSFWDFKKYSVAMETDFKGWGHAISHYKLSFRLCLPSPVFCSLEQSWCSSPSMLLICAEVALMLLLEGWDTCCFSFISPAAGNRNSNPHDPEEKCRTAEVRRETGLTKKSV